MDEVAIVRSELIHQQRDARGTIVRGVLLIVFVPIVVAAALLAVFAMPGMPALIALLLGAGYALIGGIAGIVTIGAGAVEYRRLGKRVHDYDHVRQLPQARLVVRHSPPADQI